MESEFVGLTMDWTGIAAIITALGVIILGIFTTRSNNKHSANERRLEFDTKPLS